MDDSLLDPGLWVYRLYGLRESGKPIHTGDQDILHTAVLKPVHDGKPELGALVFPHIHTKHILFPIHVNAKSDIDRTFYNPFPAADMVMDGIHKDYSINFF